MGLIRGRPSTVWGYFMAVKVADINSYSSIDKVEGSTFNENKDDDISNNLEHQKIKILDKEQSTEEKVIKNDLYFKLSKEAKAIVDIIVNGPAEFMDILTPKTGNITKRTISNFITKFIFNRTVPTKQTKRIMNELKDFVSNF